MPPAPSAIPPKLPSVIVPVWARYLIVVFLLLGIGSLTLTLSTTLYKYPPVNMDEAVFTQPAQILHQRGVLATELLSGTLPGIDQHTYWMPPVYLLLVWLLLFVAPYDLETIRIFGLVLQGVVLVLLYLVSRRAGLGKWGALTPSACLLVDPAFFAQTAYARMDVPAITCLLAATLIFLQDKPKGVLLNRFAAGFVASLAALTHPIGLAAPVGVFLASVLTRLSPERPKSSSGLAIVLATGLLLPFAIWGFYIFQAPTAFKDQMQVQLQRKHFVASPVQNIGVDEHRSSEDRAYSLLGTLRNFGGLLYVWAGLYYYPLHRYVFYVLWISGFAGLLGTAWRDRRRLILPLLWLLTAGIALRGGEYWYVVYLLPLTYLGVALVAREIWAVAGRWIPYRRCAGGIIIICAVLVGLTGFMRQGRISAMTRLIQQTPLTGVEPDYGTWCGKVSEAIPHSGQTRVLFSYSCCPYFGLKDRADLTLHTLLPPGIATPESTFGPYIASHNYLVVCSSDLVPDNLLAHILLENGTVVARIGRPGIGYEAIVYRMQNTTQPAVLK